MQFLLIFDVAVDCFEYFRYLFSLVRNCSYFDCAEDLDSFDAKFEFLDVGGHDAIHNNLELFCVGDVHLKFTHLVSFSFAVLLFSFFFLRILPLQGFLNAFNEFLIFLNFLIRIEYLFLLTILCNYSLLFLIKLVLICVVFIQSFFNFF